MNVLLIGNYIPDHQESMLRFAATLKRGLESRDYQVRLLQPPPLLGTMALGPAELKKWLGYMDKFALFPRQIRRQLRWADVIHLCDHANAMYCKHIEGKPHVVTCNDMLAIRSALGEIPQNPTRWSGRKFQHLILQGLKRARRIACISKQTRSDLLRLGQLDPRVVSVVYMGQTHNYAPMSRQRADKYLQSLSVDVGRPFFVHVGNNSWYKNRRGVLEIFRGLKARLLSANLQLVMVGKPFTADMRHFIAVNNLQQQVVELVAVSNEELCALYSKAIALIFPSLQEGFGWPIVEAQACGCPVFTTNRAPMTEVGGEAAIYIDPQDIDHAVAIILRKLPNIEQRKQPGLNNAARFATDNMLRGYMEIYNEVTNSDKRRFSNAYQQ